MKVNLIPVLLTLLAGNAFAIEFPIEITEYIDDTKVDSYISSSVISDKSKWEPFESALPLSLNDALKAVDVYLDADPAFKHSSLIGIELKPIPNHESYWHYLAKLKSEINGKRQFHFIVVLMDGQVISAFREPESIK